MSWVWIVSGVGLSAVLVALAVVDLRTYRLPDMLTLPLALAGLIVNWWLTGQWLPFVAGLVVGYGAFVILEGVYRHARGREGLGRGDAKLLAAGGAWIGWAALPQAVLVASASAIAMLLLFRNRLMDLQGRVPFGPFLALGIGAVWGAQRFAGL